MSDTHFRTRLTNKFFTGRLCNSLPQRAAEWEKKIYKCFDDKGNQQKMGIKRREIKWSVNNYIFEAWNMLQGLQIHSCFFHIHFYAWSHSYLNAARINRERSHEGSCQVYNRREVRNAACLWKHWRQRAAGESVLSLRMKFRIGSDDESW